MLSSDIPFTLLLVKCEKTSVYSVMFGKLSIGTARTLHSAPPKPFMAAGRGRIKRSFVAKQQVLRGRKMSILPRWRPILSPPE